MGLTGRTSLGPVDCLNSIWVVRQGTIGSSPSFVIVRANVGFRITRLAVQVQPSVRRLITGPWNDLALRRLTETKLPDCEGFSFVFKA